jgi:hypothetical protein
VWNSFDVGFIQAATVTAAVFLVGIFLHRRPRVTAGAAAIISCQSTRVKRKEEEEGKSEKPHLGSIRREKRGCRQQLVAASCSQREELHEPSSGNGGDIAAIRYE